MSEDQILIVDDSALVAQQLARVLELHREQLPFEVQICHAADKALDWLRQGDVRLLVSDLRLPDMNGLQLIQEARVIAPQTRTLLMTAFATHELEKQLEERNINYLAKPFSLKQFLQKVASILDEPPVSAAEAPED